jgi:hypothetical protein
MNASREIGKALGTLAVWGGVAIMTYLFGTFHVLTGDLAIGIAVGGGLLTAYIWW